MKNSILLPLILGLLLAGCGRSEIDSKKLSANDQLTADKPAVVAAYESPRPAPVAAYESPRPAPVAATSSAGLTADKNAMPDRAKSASDSTVAATNASSDAAAIPAATEPAAATFAAPAPERTLPDSSSSGLATAAAATTAKESTATETKPGVVAPAGEVKFTAAEIKSDFESSGRVVRSRAARADEPTGSMDSNLVNLVTSKLRGEADTAELKLGVTAEKGVVSLTGAAKNLGQVATAIATALDTDGVTQVISTITLTPAN